MKVAFVEIAGFRGFRDKVRFEFPGGFTVLTGPNGVGKSTAFDAIDFALTGSINKYTVKEAKGGGLDEHTWWVGEGRPSEQYVSVGFENSDGEIFHVTRSREQGSNVSADEISERLCIGKPYADWVTTLMQTTLIRDETIAALSLDLPEQARFAALRSATGGLRGADHSQRTDELLRAAMATKDEQAERVAATEADLGRALSTLTEERSAAEHYSNIAEAKHTISTLTAEMHLEPTNSLAHLRQLLADRTRVLPLLNDSLRQWEALNAEQEYFRSETARNDLAAAEATLKESREQQTLTEQTLASAEIALEAARQNDAFANHMVALLAHGEALGLQEGHCPLCAAVRTNEEFVQSIVAARDRLKDRAAAVALAQANLDEARFLVSQTSKQMIEAQNRLSEIRNRESRLTRGLQALQELYSKLNLRISPTNLIELREVVLKWREDTTRMEQALLVLEGSGATDRVVMLESRVTQLRSALDSELARLSSAEHAVESARQIDNAAKAVGNQVLAEQFDTVMPLLKELYRRLRPHTEWKEIELDFGGRVRASLNFTVGDGKNPQFLFSSGQRRAAGLAFLLAIHLSRGWSALKTLLLDDPVQHIDDYRALNLVEVLSAIRRSGRQVIIAVEDPALADVLCRRLRSTALESGRRFDVFTKPNGSAGILRQTEFLPLSNATMQVAEAS